MATAKVYGGALGWGELSGWRGVLYELTWSGQASDAFALAPSLP